MKKVEDSLGTHLGDELVRIAVIEKIVVLIKTVVDNVDILFLCEEIHLMRSIEILHTLGILCPSETTRLDDDVLLIIDDGIEVLCRHTKEITNLVRKRTEVPDMSHRHNELDVSLTLTTYFLLCHLHTTTVADNPFIADALVFTAGALIVFCRTEDALAEQAVTLRLVGAVVDCLRLGNLTIRIFLNLLRRSETNGNLREIGLYLCIFFESHIPYLVCEYFSL